MPEPQTITQANGQEQQEYDKYGMPDCSDSMVYRYKWLGIGAIEGDHREILNMDGIRRVLDIPSVRETFREYAQVLGSKPEIVQWLR